MNSDDCKCIQINVEDDAEETEAKRHFKKSEDEFSTKSTSLKIIKWKCSLLVIF